MHGHPPWTHAGDPDAATQGSSALTPRRTRPPPPPADAPAGPRDGRADDGYAPVFWTAFRRSANPMALLDLDRRIVAANDASAALAVRSAESLAGQAFQTLLDDPAEALDEETWRKQVLQGESFGYRRLRRPDGTTRIVASRCGPRASMAACSCSACASTNGPATPRTVRTSPRRSRRAS